MFVTYVSGMLTSWLTSDISIMSKFAKEFPLFYQGTLWIPSKFYTKSSIPIYLCILKSIQSGWIYCIHHYNTAEFGNSIAAQRVSLKIFCMSDTDSNLSGRYEPTHKEEDYFRYERFIHQELNYPMELYSVSLPKNVLTHLPASHRGIN